MTTDQAYELIHGVLEVGALVLVLANHLMLRYERRRRVSSHHPTRQRR